MLYSTPSRAEDTEQLDHVPRFYLQMKNEDFLRAMVPKEKFLLSLVQNVNQEIWRRKSEGLQESDLGMEELVSPEERVVEAHAGGQGGRREVPERAGRCARRRWGRLRR